ncbi:hypothetical protein MIMGU_mgv1a016802mg [Erythranthe guttata]|uniref:Uncharacterized protein n=1 Tax=Erythranthe guttata TaxID=4155 RepID=A0A022QXP6_ERYGU|nr:hypothetical protein MIMGU_mgv1a016802mg [Erythranthe guttata]
MKQSGVVRFKNTPTKTTYDSFPRLAVKWDVTKPRQSFHIRHRGAVPAPRARPRHRLASPHHALLIHQKTETNHQCPNFIYKYMRGPFSREREGGREREREREAYPI